MPDLSSLFLYFTSQAFIFLVAEIIEWFILIHDAAGWHFRFSSPEDYPKLRPIISTFKAALIIFAVLLIISPFLLPEIWNRFIVNSIGSTRYWFLLFFLSITFSFLWIWHHIVGKDWNLGQILLGILSILFLVVYLWLNLS